MKKLLVLLSITLLSGCSTMNNLQKYWPRPHDPIMFGYLVSTDIEISKVDCEKSNWSNVITYTEQLAKYTEWRNDPQQDNIKGLHSHAIKMNSGASKTFCELGKKTASQRVNATKTAWEKR